MNIEEIILIGICIVFILIPFLLKTKGNFFEGTKDNDLLTTIFSISASWIGVSSMLVLSGWILELGQAAIWYLLSPGIGLILLGFFGIEKIRKFDGMTISDYYNEKVIKISISIIISLVYTFVLGAQIVGFAKISVGFNISYTFGLLLSSIVIITYVSLGGFKAVATTDIIQAILIFITLIGFIIVLPISLDNINLSQMMNPFTLKQPYGILFLILGLMMLVAQENHQRIRAAKTNKIAATATKVSGLIIITFTLIIFLVTISMGSVKGNPIIYTISNLKLLYKIIFSIGLLGAALSTADTALNISSYSIFTLFGRIGNKKLLFVIIIFVTMVSSAIAHFIPSISQIILVSINLYVGILFPLMLLKFLNLHKRINIYVFIISVIGFIIGLVISPASSGLISMVFGIISIIILSRVFQGKGYDS